MRHLFLVIDMSQAMGDQDLKPTRLVSSLKVKHSQLSIVSPNNEHCYINYQVMSPLILQLKNGSIIAILHFFLTRFNCHLIFLCYLILLFQLLEHFVDEYFDQNPISQMGIIFTKNKRAEKVTELGGMCINNTVVVTIYVHPLLFGVKTWIQIQVWCQPKVSVRPTT